MWGRGGRALRVRGRRVCAASNDPQQTETEATANAAPSPKQLDLNELLGEPDDAAETQPVGLKKWTAAHNDRCEVCDKGGDLLCCDFCNLQERICKALQKIRFLYLFKAAPDDRKRIHLLSCTGPGNGACFGDLPSSEGVR